MVFYEAARFRWYFPDTRIFQCYETNFSYNLNVAEKSEDFLASRFSLLVVQISKVDYHRSENKRDVW
jgi:hypothetical protein